jgi:hypothetical protein
VGHASIVGHVLLMALLVVTLAVSIVAVRAPIVPPSGTYTLTPVPYSTQEGNSVDLWLYASGVTPGIQYQFDFHVKDPTSKVWNSSSQTITPTGSTFTIRLTYPSSSFQGTTSFVGQYNAWVNETMPLFTGSTGIASSHFLVLLTDKSEYQRTQTVSIQGSGYNVGDSVTVSIVRQTGSVLVFSQSVVASSSGLVTTTWKIPKNATIDNYIVSLAGKSTPAKSPADLETFGVTVATISIASLSSQGSTYQRTQTMQFSFQPLYPSAEIATTGSAVIPLTRPDGKTISLTTRPFDNVTQTFSAIYTTFRDNQTGTWTASLRANGFVDAYGNYGPIAPLTTSPQLQPAQLLINITTSSNFQVGQPIRLNATIQYPDDTPFQAGRVSAFFTYTAGGHNDSIPIAYDSTLQLWIGSYTPQSGEPGGLWSITVVASDTPLSPANSGSASRVVTLQGSSAPSPSLPLYWFAIIAALIAAAFLGIFLAFRRRRVTHARLKIDLEAVKSEADRIEENSFFKSVKDQLNKDKKEPDA